MKYRPVLFILLFVIAFSQSFGQSWGDGEVAGQYVKWAEQAIAENRFTAFRNHFLARYTESSE